MPELPDITVYIEALSKRIEGQKLNRFVLQSPFVLRTVEPAPSAIIGRKVLTIRRLGKRIAIGFEGDYWIVIHLMIAARVVDLPLPVGPVTSTKPILILQNSLITSGRSRSSRDMVSNGTRRKTAAK